VNKGRTRNSNNQLHSFNDKPALVCYNGAKYWYSNGNIHRDNGKPAIIHSFGTKRWFINGKELTIKQIKLLYKINASEIQHLLWLLNEDELLNSVIEKRLNEGS
jgi:hypothetical protein